MSGHDGACAWAIDTAAMSQTVLFGTCSDACEMHSKSCPECMSDLVRAVQSVDSQCQWRAEVAGYGPDKK